MTSAVMGKVSPQKNYNSTSISLQIFFRKCEGPFLDNVQAQIEARTLGLLVVVSRDLAWFTTAKWADYKPSGVQSKNPTIHTY